MIMLYTGKNYDPFPKFINSCILVIFLSFSPFSFVFAFCNKIKVHVLVQHQTAKICYCCSQPFYSSFVALEAILKCCSSTARFVWGHPINTGTFNGPFSVHINRV